MQRKVKLGLSVMATLVLAITISTVPQVAYAADSVSVPGQVGVDQCPAGYQHSTGISVNATTGVYTTICNAPPNDADLLVQQQDQDFQARINAAQSAAEAQSQAWNAANPGQQKCVQWGPIVHANGVSTSSGGVCANPVALGEGQSTPSQDAEDVVATVPVLTPNQNIVGSGAPFYKEVTGQVGVEGCPTGYQAANGLTVNATTGAVTTQCWSTDAWAAYRLGGVAWDKYQATGGGYDVTAEIDRRDKLAALVAQAQQVAQAAADATPGVRRCSTWTGYNESGRECAYTFVDPSAAAPATDNQEDQTVTNPESQEAATLMTATFFKVKKATKSETKIKSLTPKVCKVSSLTVKSLKAGTCTYKVTSTKANGKKTTAKKQVVFVR